MSSTFESYLNDVAQQADTDGVSFDAALQQALAAEDPAMDDAGQSGANTYAENETGQNGSPDTVRSLIDMDGMIAAIRTIMPMQFEATLATNGWTDSGNEEYPFAYTYANSAFKQNMRADMYISIDSAASAQAAGLYPVTNTQDGYTLLLAETAPDSDLSVTFTLTPVLHS